MLKKEKQFLENYSDEYIKPDLTRRVDRRIEELVDQFTLSWVKGPRVLEMGFGDGVWTRHLVKKFGRSEIVDASTILLSMAKKKFGNKVTLHESLFEKFVPPYKFDTVIASYILEHVIDPVQILKKSTQWLTKNGRVIIIVPNATSLHRRLGVEMGIMKRVNELGRADIKIGHRRVYTTKLMEEHIKKAGLKVQRHDGVFLKAVPNSMMENFPDKVLAGLMTVGQKLGPQFCNTIIYQCVKA